MRLELEKHLPEELLSLLKSAGDLAQGSNLYLVGGAVRDLIMGRLSLDLDLVLEGDAISLARKLAEGGGKVVAHPRFGTAKFRHHNLSLDIATARWESYSKPGALPTVKPGTIDDDLKRRDFTINAIAVCLHPACFGEPLDPYDGRGDIEHRLIRVLHKNSFCDDPTRILRALRYEQRLDFHLEQSTEELLLRDVAMLGEVSGGRLRHELEHILSEEYPEKVLRRAQELGVLERLHPSLKWDDWTAQRFRRVRETSPKPSIALYLAILAHRLSEEECQSLIARLGIAGRSAQAVRQAVKMRQALPNLATPKLSRSSVYHLLKGYSPEAITATVIATDSPLIRERLELYLSELRHIKLILNGDDLKPQGVSPGRKMGELLRALLDARLNGEVKTEEDERRLVHRLLSNKPF
jgi:tRNA nucleotidyltransferase (CCA-adding enzyme)